MFNDDVETTTVKEVEVADSVIASIVEKVTLQVEGVSGFNARFYDEMVDGITERFGQKRATGIAVKQSKKEIEITVHIVVTLERSLIELGQDVQETVSSALSLMLDIQHPIINVHIDDIAVQTAAPLSETEE